MSFYDFKNSCLAGDISSVKEFLFSEPNLINEENGKSLIIACQKGDYDLAVYLMSQPQLNKQYLCDMLLDACESKSLKLVKFLTEHEQLSQIWGDMNDECLVCILHKNKEFLNYFILERNVKISEQVLTTARNHFSNVKGKNWLEEVQALVDSKATYDKLSVLPEKNKTSKIKI